MCMTVHQALQDMGTYELDLLRRWPLARHLDGQPLQFMFLDRRAPPCCCVPVMASGRHSWRLLLVSMMPGRAAILHMNGSGRNHTLTSFCACAGPRTACCLPSMHGI